MSELTKQQKYSMDLKDIAKIVKQKLKKEYPGCVFSVTIERYSMGQSLTVALMKSDIKIIKDFKDISDKAFWSYESRSHYTKDQIEESQKKDYHQLNPYTFNDDYNPDIWSNGIFLTEQGHNMLKRVNDIVNYYNYNDSDSQTDYYDVNFSLSMHIGKWNKDFIDGEDPNEVKPEPKPEIPKVIFGKLVTYNDGKIIFKSNNSDSKDYIINGTLEEVV